MSSWKSLDSGLQNSGSPMQEVILCKTSQNVNKNNQETCGKNHRKNFSK